MGLNQHKDLLIFNEFTASDLYSQGSTSITSAADELFYIVISLRSCSLHSMTGVIPAVTGIDNQLIDNQFAAGT